jgi:hypothetical protein
VRNEGEDNAPSIPQVEVPTTPHTEANAKTIAEPHPATPPPVSEPLVPPTPTPEPDPPARRIRKPSQHILDIIEGRAITSLHSSASQIPRGVQIPPPVQEEPPRAEPAMLEGEGQSEFIMTAENLDGYALAAKMSDAEGC